MAERQDILVKVKLTQAEADALDQKRAALGRLPRATYLRRFGLGSPQKNGDVAEIVGQIALEVNKISAKDYRGLPKMRDEIRILLSAIYEKIGNAK